MSSVNSDPTAPVDGPVPAVEDQENDGDQEGQDARNTLGGDESGVDGGGSPVGVEDVDALAPNVRVTVENLSSSEHHMPVDDPASHRGENSPAASAVSSIESTESMGDPRRSVPGGNGGRGGGRIIAGDNSGGGTSARELERVGSDGIDDCQVDDGELSGSLDDDSRIGAIPMEMDRRPMRCCSDLSLFDKVRLGLRESNTVGWDNAHLSIELAIRVYDNPVGKRFLSEFLHQITSIMLDQHVSKMGHHERKCTARSLEMSCNVLSMLMRNDRMEFLDTVVMIFDPTRTLYNASKAMWSTAPGAPEQRVNLCQQFMSCGGFAAVVAMLEKQATRLQEQARARAEARATAADRARRSQLAQAEARQAQQAVMLVEDGSAVSRGRSGTLRASSTASLSTTSESDASIASNSPAAGDEGRGGVRGEGGSRSDDSRGEGSGISGGGVDGHPASASRAAALAAKAVEAAVAANAEYETAAAAAAAAAANGEQWIGSDHLATLLGALAECSVDQPTNAVSIALKMCRAVMAQVKVLSEEELKKENQDSLGLLVRHLRNLMVPIGEVQMRQVEGAGTPCCNGVYRVAPEFAENIPQSAYHSGRVRIGGGRLGSGGGTLDDEDVPKYTYQAKGGPLLTLFRCKMRTKAYWWFISEADPNAPGTDKDVDYYQRKSTSMENYTPERVGWEAATDNKTSVKGINPAPTVTPCEGVLCPLGQERDCLEWDLVRWTIENKVVEEIFGDSIHREVVGRSSKLLRFLSSMEGALTTEHLDLIWRCCVGKAEPELQGVVYQLLTTLVDCMKPELVCHLIGRLQDSADGAGAGKGGGRHEVLAFVENLANNQAQTMLTRNRAVCSVAQELLWSLMREPSVVRHKACEAVTNFFAVMLRTATSSALTGGSAYSHQDKFLGQCIDFLRKKAACTPPDCYLGEAEEAAVSRSLELIRFLLESFHQKHVGAVVQGYAFPKRTKVQHRARQSVRPQGQGEGEGTSQGRAREQASGESAGEHPTSSTVALGSGVAVGENGGGRAAGGEGVAGGEGASGEEEGLPVLLLRELASFKKRFPSRVGKHLRADEAEVVLKTQVRQRLDLIRYIHGLAPSVNLSVEQLRGLWGILTSPAERELCLAFLQECASPQEHLETAFGDEERLFLFRELICKDVDWTGLGMPAYSCFNAFFTRIWSEAAIGADSVPAMFAGGRVLNSSGSSSARMFTATIAGSASSASGIGTSSAPMSASSAPLSLPQPPRLIGTPTAVSGLRDSGVPQQSANTLGSSPLPPVPPGRTITDVGGAIDCSTQEEDLTELGIDTLWRVTLTSQNAEVAASASQDLLEVYNTPEMQRRTRVPPASTMERVDSFGSNRGGTGISIKSLAQASGTGSSKKTRPTLASSSSGGLSSQSLGDSASPGHGQVFLDSIFSHLAEAREELEGVASRKASSMTTTVMVNADGGNDERAKQEEAEEEAVRVRIRRCLGLLQGVIRGAPGIMTAPHSQRGMGLPEEVAVTFKVSPKHAGLSATSSSSVAGGAGSVVSSAPMHAPPPPPVSAMGSLGSVGGNSNLTPALSANMGPPDKYLLEVHPMETVGSVRARVAIANGTGQAVDYTRLVAGGKSLTLDTVTCQEAGLVDGTTMITLVSPNPMMNGVPGSAAFRAASDEERRRADKTVHEGDIIATQTEPFEELFRLLECAHGLEDYATTKAVLDLLMSLPTEEVLLRRVRQTGLMGQTTAASEPSAMDEDEGGEGGQEQAAAVEPSAQSDSATTGAEIGKLPSARSGVDSSTVRATNAAAAAAAAWAELLPLDKNLLKTVYTLQIIDALLLPAMQVLGAKPWAAETDMFRMGFLQGGGFARVLRVLMSTPSSSTGADRDVVLCHASALRILKTCLFYPPLTGVGRASGDGDGSVGGVGNRDSPSGVAEGGGALVARTLPPMAPPPPAAREAMKVSDGDLQELLDKLVLVSLGAQRRWLESAAAAAAAAASDDGNDSLSRHNEEMAEQRLYRQVTTDCLALVGSILAEHPPMMEALSANASAKEFVVTTLARNPAPRVRRQMGQLLVGARPIAGTLLRWLAEELEDLPLEHTDCDEFFASMRDLVFVNHQRRRRPLGGGAGMADAEEDVTMTGDDGTCVDKEAQKGKENEDKEVGGDEEVLDLRSLARVLSVKLMQMPRDGHGSCKAVLQGCLEVLRDLVEIKGPDGKLLEGTELGKDLVGKIFTGFLFTMPEQRGRGMSVERPVCADPPTRRAALNILASAARKSSRAMSALLDNVDMLVGRVLPSLRHRWGYECSFDAKRPQSGRFVGLKNQGCTCYMNSLLQQLFMVPPLRKAILEARLPRRRLEDFPRELIGRRVALQWEAGGVMEALVVAYNEQTGEHVIRYDNKENVSFRLGPGGGRPGKETGSVTLAWGDASRGGGEGKTMTPAEATAQVLEQVQRTFMHLRDGERRFFDPIRLVEACRCLNLEYMVHQQNDASEFCDKLLDRLEAGMKAGQAAVVVAASSEAAVRAGGAGGFNGDRLSGSGGDLEGVDGVGGDGDKAKPTPEKEPRAGPLERLFGGTWVRQKIPTGCSHRTNRSEPFINLEVSIRGKESIEESLASIVESELMAGDNKVDCEDCGKKKDARIRTCLDRLPNLLIVHLKRFELDYTTFETVKLNDRCSFPMVLDVKPYTLKGTDEREAMEEALQAAAEASGGDLTIEQVTRLHNEQSAKMEEDAGDYLYNLAGILVHAGVAQGGHYYSYIRDRGKQAYEDGTEPTKNSASAKHERSSNGAGLDGVDAGSGDGSGGVNGVPLEGTDGGKGAWYKFDDDDVTPFNPQEIEASCFGGTTVTTTTWNGVSNTVEHERTANALLLFYEKVRPREFPPEEEEAEKPKSNSKGSSEGDAHATPATSAAAQSKPDAAVGTETDNEPSSVGPLRAMSTGSSASNASAPPVSGSDGGGRSMSGRGSGGNSGVAEAKGDQTDNMSTSTESDLEGGGGGGGGGGGDDKSSSSGTTGLRRPGMKPGRVGARNRTGGSGGKPTVPLLDGIETYSEEVWQANVQFMLNSYVFDTEFHHFLRDIVAATVSAMDGRPVLPPVKGTGVGVGVGGRFKANEWGNSPEERSLSDRVLKMGVTQLLDVILHSRERLDVKAWEALLQRALTTSPETCRWFLESLLERPRPEGAVFWLRQITLECMDNLARHTACRLIAHACCSLSTDRTEAELLVATDRHTGRAINSGRRSPSLVAQVLASVSELMEEVGAFPRSSEEVFLLVRDLAHSCDVIRKHLLASEVAARLAIFVMRDHSPPELREEFPHLAAQQSAHTDYVHLLEAISGVLGAQRQSRADLLEEPTSISGINHSLSGHVQSAELTPLADKAFTEIFRRHSRNSGMTIDDMTRYMELCGVNGKLYESETALKNILSKYDTLDGNRLSLQGFISYYRDIAASEPRQAWNDLYHMGYRSDLTPGHGYGDEVYSDKLAADSQRRPTLPSLTTKALTSLDFYLTAAHLSTGVSMGAEAETLILCRVAMDKPKESHELILSCLREIYFLHPPTWTTDDRQEKVLFSVLLNLLKIRDGHQASRIKVAFEERQVGIMVAFKLAIESMDQRRYTILNRYPKLWHAAMKIAAVKEWREGNPEAQAIHYPGLEPAPRNPRSRPGSCQHRLGSRGGTSLPCDMPDDNDNESEYHSKIGKEKLTEVRVDGAGYALANGRYIRTDDESPTFKQKTPNRQRFTLYRCESKQMWYISLVPEGRPPGSEDAVYYEARATDDKGEDVPPQSTWQPVSSSPAIDSRKTPKVYPEGSPMETDGENEDVESEDNDLADSNQALPSLMGRGEDLMDTCNTALGSPGPDGDDLTTQDVEDVQPLDVQDVIRGNSVMSTPSSSPTTVTQPLPPSGVRRSRGRTRHGTGPRGGSGGSPNGSSSSAAI